MKTGFAGLGAMGIPMAANLSRAGLLEAVWNRTTATATDFAGEHDCAVSDDPAALAACCDVIVTCVSADEDVLSVVEQMLPGLHAGSIIIDCSTTSPTTARTAAARAAGVGAQFLDCPVTGGTEGARQGTLAILVGGDADAFARAKPVLEAMGRRIEHMGPSGAGQVSKAVNQIMVAGINQAVTEGIALAQAESLDLDKIIAALSTGAAGSWFLEHRGPNMRDDAYPLGFKVGLHAKDLRICRDIADAHDVRLPIVEMTLLHYERLLAEFPQDEEDISSLYRLKRAMFEADS
jgi:3-hydroxyisobutyrate dehydrogenase